MILQGSVLVMVTAVMVIAVTLPFAFFASVGRGYLLPIGVAVLAVLMANIMALAGWGEYFPWGAPGIYAMEGALPQASYWIVFFTGLVGILATILWWKYADQSR
jgi:ABC-2 type transport system permease protein